MKSSTVKLHQPSTKAVISSSQRSRNFTKRVTVSLAVAACAAPLSAQTAEPKTKLPTVTVQAEKGSENSGYKADTLSSPKYTAPLLDTPQTVNVISSQVLQDQQAMTLRDAMRNVTGITSAAGEGGPANGDNFNIRGFSAQNDMFIDGVRDIGGYFRDSFNLEQVEVVKGPSSAYAGRGSTGGTINQVSKKATLDNFNNAELAVGTDSLYRATADVNHKIPGLEGAAIRLNAMMHSEEVAGRDEVENNRYGFAPSITLGQGTDTRATFSYFFQMEDNLPDYGIPYLNGRPAPVDTEKFYGLVNRDYEDNEVHQFTTEIEHDFNDNMTLSNITRVGTARKENIVSPPRSPDLNAGTYTINGRDKDSENNIVLNQTNLRTDFETGTIKHSLVSGVEFSYERFNNRDRDISSVTGVSIVNPDPFATFSGTINPGDFTEIEANNMALYAFDTIELNEQWEVSGGVRFDRFDAETAVESATGAATTHSERTDYMTSYRAGVVYKPLPNGSVYAAYGTSFDPSAEPVSTSISSSTSSLENIAPEESETYEIGTKWDFFDERLGLTSAIFRTEKTNARTRATSSDPFELTGKQRVDGFEIGVTGQITPKWDVFTGYTYLASEVLASNNVAEVGNDVNRTPKHTLATWTSYQLTPEVEVGGGVYYMDDRFSNDANTNKVPDYWLVNAMAGYELTKEVDLQLNVTNLLDEEHFDSVGGGHTVPGRGRTAILSTSLKF